MSTTNFTIVAMDARFQLSKSESIMCCINLATPHWIIQKNRLPLIYLIYRINFTVFMNFKITKFKMLTVFDSIKLKNEMLEFIPLLPE